MSASDVTQTPALADNLRPVRGLIAQAEIDTARADWPGACAQLHAHALARAGHQVTVFEARAKGGGLNEYGIAAYKTNDDIAQRELAYILEVGGIGIEFGQALGRDFTIEGLRAGYDAVFLGIGLGATNAPGLGAMPEGVIDAVDFIAGLRQAADKTAVPVGRNVLVIGGGMTAIDAATQAKLLGAECVTIAYRRGKIDMPASPYEQDVAQVRDLLRGGE